MHQGRDSACLHSTRCSRHLTKRRSGRNLREWAVDKGVPFTLGSPAGPSRSVPLVILTAFRRSCSSLTFYSQDDRGSQKSRRLRLRHGKAGALLVDVWLKVPCTSPAAPPPSAPTRSTALLTAREAPTCASQGATLLLEMLGIQRKGRRQGVKNESMEEIMEHLLHNVFP